MKLAWCHARLAIAYHPLSLLQEEDRVALEEAKVTHLINCRRAPDFHRSLDILHGIAVLWNPAEDDGGPKSAEWFGRSIAFALGALASPWHKVAVCCHSGNNRSPSTALAILMSQGLSPATAETRIQLARPGSTVVYRSDAIEAIKTLGYL